MRLSHASTEDGRWLRAVLERISHRFRSQISLQPDGTLILQPPPATTRTDLSTPCVHRWNCQRAASAKMSIFSRRISMRRIAYSPSLLTFSAITEQLYPSS